MRGGRSLLVLLIVALGLGAYIYFVESERDPSGVEPRESLFSTDVADIDEIRIEGAEAFTVRRTDDKWALVDPVAAPADASVVEAIASSLASVSIDRVLEEDASDLGPFGLDNPRLTVSFRTTGGQQHELQLGSTTPTQSGLYAKTADSSRLFLIPAYFESTFTKTVFDVRDRRVLAVNRDTLDRVTIAPRGAVALDLRREDAGWRLTAPIQTRADYTTADTLVARITNARMSAIESEGGEPTAAQLRTYGLDVPQLTATLGSGSTSATLAFGRAEDDASIYARDVSRPIVFTVESSLLTDLRKQPDDLRVKDVFELNAFSALSVEFAHDAATTAYAKTTPESEEASATPVWSRTKPEAGDVNQTTLTDLLNTLSSLHAERFVPRAPAGGDVITVSARYGSTDAPRDERVTLHKAGETAYAVRDGEPGAAVIAVTQFDTVASQLKALTDTQ